MRNNRMKEAVKEQIKFICKFDNIKCDDEFLEFVYNKRLEWFSSELLKELRSEFERSK